MKVAISLPDPVFNAAELLAQELCASRSQLYAQALSAYLESPGVRKPPLERTMVWNTELPRVLLASVETNPVHGTVF